MTDIKIDTAADLESFLKILAEESVASSRVKLAEDSTGDKEYQKGVVSRIKSDKSRFDEAEEEDLEDSDADAAVAGDSSESEADQGGDQPPVGETVQEEVVSLLIGSTLFGVGAGLSTVPRPWHRGLRPCRESLPAPAESRRTPPPVPRSRPG